jgi:hypothetical protein
MLLVNALLPMLAALSVESTCDSVCVSVRPIAGEYYYSLDISMKYLGKHALTVQESALPWSDSSRLSLKFVLNEGCPKTVDETISISDAVIGRVTLHPAKTVRGSLQLFNFPSLKDVVASCEVRVTWHYELADDEGRSIGSSSGMFPLGP